MCLNSSLSREAILDSTKRFPLSHAEQVVLLAHLHVTRRDGLDLTIDAILENDTEQMIKGGFVLLKSAFLRADFMLVNIDAGRSFLGCQRTHILTFRSDTGKDAWIPLLAPGKLKFTLSAIDNMYRYAGTTKETNRPRQSRAVFETDPSLL